MLIHHSATLCYQVFIIGILILLFGCLVFKLEIWILNMHSYCALSSILKIEDYKIITFELPPNNVLIVYY